MTGGVGGGSSQKTNTEEGLPKIRGLGQFRNLRWGGEGLGKKEGVWYLDAHYEKDGEQNI